MIYLTEEEFHQRTPYTVQYNVDLEGRSGFNHRFDALIRYMGNSLGIVFIDPIVWRKVIILLVMEFDSLVSLAVITQNVDQKIRHFLENQGIIIAKSIEEAAAIFRDSYLITSPKTAQDKYPSI